MDNARLITKRDYRLVAIWAVAVLLAYAIICAYGVRKLTEYKAETNRNREALLKSAIIEPGHATDDATVPPGGRPVDVTVGVLVNEISNFQLREASWSADFDLWFRWTGEDVNPGEGYRIMNGAVETVERTVAESLGDQHYERYRVRARLRKVFDPARFPFASEALGIQVENRGVGTRAVRYVADDRWSRVDKTALPPALRLIKTVAGIRTEEGLSEGEGLGTQGQPGRVKREVVFAMLVEPIVGARYFMMFQALFASVAVTLLVFFIKPVHVDPRFGLGVGGFFAAVGSNIAISAALPSVDRVTLVNMINGVGLATIFLTLVESTISLYIFDTMGRERLSRFLDYVSLAAILVGYVVVNVALPLAARM